MAATPTRLLARVPISYFTNLFPKFMFARLINIKPVCLCFLCDVQFQNGHYVLRVGLITPDIPNFKNQDLVSV